MSQEVSPRLSHVGIYVTDLPKMSDFYTNVLGFVVSDAAPDGRITFLSRNPSDHHQVVLVPGRKTELETPMMQQISFNVGTLGNVQRAFRKVRDAGCQGLRPVSHGNAWSIYFHDPEGNRIEMFCDTPWYVSQPCGFRDRPRQVRGRAVPRDRGPLPHPAGLQADGGVAGGNLPKNRGEARSLKRSLWAVAPRRGRVFRSGQ